MARIFRTEKLNLNGDIILSTSAQGTFELTNASGSTLMSRATLESDISSLAITDNKTNSDVSSLAFEDNRHDSDISSLAQSSGGATGQLGSDVSSLKVSDDKLASDISSLKVDNDTDNSDISSLAFEDDRQDSDVSSLKVSDDKLASDISSLKVDNDTDNSDISSLKVSDQQHNSDISSLKVAIDTNDVVAKSEIVASGSESKTVAFARTFSAAPVVVAILRSTDANDPIMPCMVTAVSTTGCTVSFGDGIPSANYTLEVIASVAG